MPSNEHQDSGEAHSDVQPSAVTVRSGPSVIWDPTSDRGGITFESMDNAKFVIHTTETKGLPSYPYPPHVTVNPNEPDTIWHHVTGDKGAYALKSAPQSPNYEAGAVYQSEHIAYAADTPEQGDTFYESIARECVWFNRNKGVPLEFVPVWEGGDAYGEWSGRMSAAEFAEFSGICGHQHVNDNSHWDPGRLDIPRLKDAIAKWLEVTDPDEIEGGEEMILVEGAGGNAVTSMQRSLNGWAESSGKDWRVGVDGTWEAGSKLTQRLKEYQKALNLTESGTLDGLTAGYLLRFDPPKL